MAVALTIAVILITTGTAAIILGLMAPTNARGTFTPPEVEDRVDSRRNQSEIYAPRGLATFPRSRKTSSRVGMGISTGSPLAGWVSCVGSEPFFFGILRQG